MNPPPKKDRDSASVPVSAPVNAPASVPASATVNDDANHSLEDSQNPRSDTISTGDGQTMSSQNKGAKPSTTPEPSIEEETEFNDNLLGEDVANMEESHDPVANGKHRQKANGTNGTTIAIDTSQSPPKKNGDLLALNNLEQCRIPLSCEISRFDLSLSELRHLRPGQIFSLPVKDFRSLILRSAGQNLARCECVKDENDNLALRILEVSDSGKSTNHE